MEITQIKTTDLATHKSLVVIMCGLITFLLTQFKFVVLSLPIRITIIPKKMETLSKFPVFSKTPK